MYMHLSWLQKTLGLDGAFRYHRQALLHLFPPSFPKFLPQSGFSEIPMWLGFCHLPLSRRRQVEEVLPSVSSWFDANPTLFPHPVQGACQRGAIHNETRAQPFLIGLPHGGQCRQQTELCDLQACLSDFLVIDPRNDPREPAQALARAGEFKKRVGGRCFQSFRFHTTCIYI